MAIIKKSSNNKCWEKCGEKGTLLHRWRECKLVQPLAWFFRKLNIELPCDPAMPLMGIYLDKTSTQKDSCTPMFTVALFTIADTWKQLKCPSRWMKTTWYIYTIAYYLAIKKNKIMPSAATWMQLEIITLSEVRKRKTNTIYFTHM